MITTRRRPLRSAFAVLLVLSFCWVSAAPSSTTTASAKGDEPGIVARPYRLDQPGGYRLTPLDPQTLADARGVPAIELGGTRMSAQGAPTIVSSSDGSIVAAIYQRIAGNGPGQARNYSVVLRDAATGARRGPVFHPRVPLFIEAISADGKELSGFRQTTNGTPVEWDTIQAYTGRVISKVRFPAGSWGDPIYDAQNDRMYVLHEPPTTQATGPLTPSLIVYNATTGAQTGQLTLDGVLAGSWMVDPTSNDPSFTMLSPGYALSPDGSRIAIVDPTSETIKVVDTRSMKVLTSETLARPQSLLERVAGWLGVLPTAAEAKRITGTQIQISFSADGKLLYVTGNRWNLDKEGNQVTQGLGLRTVDVATGEIKAEAFQGHWVTTMMAPDGSALYALTDDAQGCPCTFSRLDPTTLKVTSARSSPWEMPQLYLLRGYGQ